jgi:hypothetical protein
MAIKPPVTMPKNDRDFFRWLREAFDERLKFGTGSPLNVVTADVGTLYMRVDGGANTTLYVKESGNGASTGWVAK